ncbi:hypothetical protein MBEHAL_0669 [Halarchaeum acidiphilum MH1-52-1]|uniref:GAF domain-containing protein n=1 Tax=Halarchaeum acidiphilum MH1-52-1 TaxID=1261545 RepID=U3A2P3_9EURY|nr:GAF domain-containing protein [Halarchaeum acidiphilum]GAD51909.1 hypothetical protein MBEHAL_0669 [Halarchaeum acidiphilum MH1-52-1]
MSDEGALSVVHVTADTDDQSGLTLGDVDGLDVTRTPIDEIDGALDGVDAVFADAAVARSEALAALVRETGTACVVADDETDRDAAVETLRTAVESEWVGYPVPANEPARLDALAAHDFGDSTLRAHLEGMTATARECVDAEVGFIGLIGERTETVVTAQGVEMDERARDRTVCAHGITGTGTLVVADLAADARGASVGPGIEFYAGAPVTAANGERIGMLCVADGDGGGFDAADERALERLAEHTSDYIDRYGRTE